MNSNSLTSPKKELLFLITCIFLINAVSELITLPAYICILYTHSGIVTSTGWLDTIVEMLIIISPTLDIVFTAVVYFLLLRKDLPMSRRSKTGVALMTLTLIIRIVYIILEHLDCIPTEPFVLGVTSLLMSIMFIVGLFMFINGCEVSVRLKRFIKWTPFITMIATCVYKIITSIFFEFMDDVNFEYIITLTLTLTYLFFVHRMCKQE